MIHWNGTTDGQRFTRAQHMSTMLSKVIKDLSLFSQKSMGNVLSNKEYVCFILLMTLSTCIWTFAIRLVNSTSSGFNSFLRLVKERLTNCAPCVPNDSEIMNPLCAITLSSWFIFLKRFDILWYAGHLIPAASFWNKTNWTLWSNTNQIFCSVVMFVRRPS